MGFSAPKRTAKLFALIMIVALNSACSETPANPTEADEVQSINVFFTTEDVAGSRVGKAMSFSPSSGLLNEIDTINNTPDSVAVLDTDENAPGFEFAAYASGRELKIIDYSKSATQRVYTLEEYSTDICGVYPAKRPAFSAFDTASEYYLQTIDDTAVYVALKVGADCSRVTDSYRRISFNIPGFPLIGESRQVANSEVFGAFMFQPNFRGTDDDGEEIRGRSVWLSHNRDTEALIATVYNGPNLFEIPFRYQSSPLPSGNEQTQPPFVIPLSNDRVLIQKNLREFDGGGSLISSTAQLFEFSVGILEGLLGVSSDGAISPENRVETFFSIPISEIALTEQSSKFNHVIRGNIVILEADQGAYRYEFDSNNLELAYDRDSELSLVDFTFASVGDGTLVINKNFGSYESLALVPNSETIAQIPVINSADRIDIKASDGSIYINALRPSNVLNEPVTSSTWIAAQVTEDRIISQIEGASFLILATASDTNEILLASATRDSGDDRLLDPYISRYDENAINGIFGFDELSEDGERVIGRTEARFGQINGEVTAFSNDIYGANFAANNDFAIFQLQTINSTRAYYLKPDQTETEEGSREPSLERIKTEEELLDVVGNAKSVFAKSNTNNLEL